MTDNKIKHLEFIQNTINRMSTNSFIIKGWLITLVSALFLFGKNDINEKFIIISLISTIAFWYINTLFLRQERKFRALYNEVRKKDNIHIDFSMDTGQYEKEEFSVADCLFSNTIWPLYLAVLLIQIIIIFVL
ncbi:hypothetical protein DET49_104115 [Salegentibacter sp. 24]|uniref:hypothetical protein n=1 Tax=Salegentibacter sp. 24 TaxID=2183986 RepID=UPI00105E5A69|nr:hypothetical protein [Salegentibacter sp. 24]TDN93389.1 hypothetical protein DET49_104115 [Salegentibacter sp. 24]